MIHLAIDIGASSGRHILGCLRDGKLELEEVYRFENGIHNENGVLVWDIENLVKEVKAGIAKCQQIGKVPATIAIDTWGVDYVLLDGDQQEILPAVSYRDSRTDAAAEAVAQILPQSALYARTGIQQQNFNTIYQLTALKRENPELLEKAKSFLMTPEYYSFLLTGKKANEYTNATTGALVNAESKNWDFEVLEKLSIPTHIFGELKTPMTSIIGYADLLRGQEMNARDAQEAANYIFTEGKRLESLSLKLLSLHLAKNETPDLEWVEVNRLVERTAKKMRPVLMQSGIRLECRTTPGKWRMDAALMESVLTNLLDNARKAMEKEGMVAMVLDFPDGDCRIRVIDNGRGMPPEVISHLTEAFYRVDKSRSRAQGGAGLGLSLCNEIVQYHGGELQFESIEGKGTCVSVILKEGAV